MLLFKKKKKSNLIYNSDIAFVVQLVCSCRATAIFISFCPCTRPRFPPVCHIIITWPDALIWTGELLHPDWVEYDTPAHIPHYFINCFFQVTVQPRRWWVWVIFFVLGFFFFFLPSVCAGSEHAPVHTVPRCSLAGLVNHLPVTGGGNTTAGLAVQRWRLARSWVRCLALLLPL